MNEITNNTGRSITIEAIGKRKWRKKVNNGQTMIINKKFIPATYICTGVRMQQIATISAKGKIIARLWFALLEQGNKKYHIQAILTDPSVGTKVQKKDIIALDSLRYYKPDMYAKLRETVNISLLGRKADYGPLPVELRDATLEITPAPHAIVTKPAKKAGKTD